MTDIIKTSQLQDPGSSLVTLYELEYAPGSFAYFYPGYKDFVSGTLENIKFRDFRAGQEGAELEYIALPIEAEGFDYQSNGAISRPILKVSILESTFSSSLGGLRYEDLIGTKLVKRTTLKKYLVGEASDVGAGLAPIEYPRTSYSIDRIKQKTFMEITFELAAPFDLQGVTLPRRVVVGGSCPFRYKGAAKELPYADRIGGCDWNTKRRGLQAGDDKRVYLNEFDEYIVPLDQGLTFTAHTGQSSVVGDYYTTATTLVQIDQELILGTVSALDYWQALTINTESPSDSDKTNWRRVRVYVAYNASSTYNAYREKKHNEYVQTGHILWKVKKKTINPAAEGISLEENAYWTIGDRCAKKLNSCALRYHATSGGGNGSVGVTLKTTEHLRFGGYPGVTQKR